MKKLKCTSCGAALEIEENNEYAKCTHCKSRYKLNEDLNINFKIDDNTKKIISSSFLLVLVPVIVIVIGIVLVFIFKGNSQENSSIMNDMNQIREDAEKHQEEFRKEAEKKSFNFQFENKTGTTDAFFLESTLDDIISSNKKYDRKVSLVFNNNETQDEEEIIKIKQSLKGKYEVSINYNDEGYIDKVIVNTVK